MFTKGERGYPMKNMLGIYIFCDKKGIGLGNVSFKSNNGKVSYENIKAIENYIKCNYDFENVVIIELE